MTNTKDTALKLALEKINKAREKVAALCDGKERWTMSVPVRPDYDHDVVISGALSVAEDALKQAQTQTVQESVGWKWDQAPIKTSWGHKMVVADLAIDKDNTVSVYCERDQTDKVEAMLTTPPAAQRQWTNIDIDKLSVLAGFDPSQKVELGLVRSVVKTILRKENT